MCFNANRSHLLHHCRNPCSTAFPYRPEFSPVSHLSSPRAKHVHLTPFGNKKKHRGKSWRGVLLYLHASFFFLHCTVITGASGLHVYKSCIGQLMHCRKSAHFGCNYSDRRSCMVSHGGPSVFCLTVLDHKYYSTFSALNI